MQSNPDQDALSAGASIEKFPVGTPETSPSQGPLLSECRLLLQHSQEIVKHAESHAKWAVGTCLAAVSTIIAVAAIFGAANYWSLAAQVSDLKDRLARLEANQFFEVSADGSRITVKDPKK